MENGLQKFIFINVRLVKVLLNQPFDIKLHFIFSEGKIKLD